MHQRSQHFNSAKKKKNSLWELMVTELRRSWIGHISNTVPYARKPSNLDKVFHCTSVSPYCLPGIPSRHVAERGWYKHVIVPVIHLHMSLYNYSSCPRRPTLHQLRAKEKPTDVFNWWALENFNNADVSIKTIYIVCRLAHKKELRTNMKLVNGINHYLIRKKIYNFHILLHYL